MSTKSLFLALALVFSLPAAAQDEKQAGDSARPDCPEPASGEWRERRGYHGGRHGGGHRGGRHAGRDGDYGPRGAGRGRGCRGGGHRHWNIPADAARTLNPVEVSPESMTRGKAVFEQNCQRCHGEFGFGDGPDAAGLSVRPVPLRHAARMHSDGELDYIIRSGRDPMPSWQDKLSQEQIWDVINFIRFDLGARRGPPFSQRDDNRFGRIVDDAGSDGHDGMQSGGMHGGMGMHGDMHEQMMQHHEDMQHDMSGDHEDHHRQMEDAMQEREAPHDHQHHETAR